MSEWLDRYGGAGGTELPVPCGEALWVGDKLYGHQARLLERVEAVGWLPVVLAGGTGGTEFVSAGSGAIAVACVRSFSGIWLGVAGAFLDRAGGVWGCEGGVWELYGLSACGVCAGSGVGFVGVVEYGAVSACWGWWRFLLCVGCGGCVVWGWEGNFRTPSRYP